MDRDLIAARAVLLEREAIARDSLTPRRLVIAGQALRANQNDFFTHILYHTIQSLKRKKYSTSQAQKSIGKQRGGLFVRIELAHRGDFRGDPGNLAVTLMEDLADLRERITEDAISDDRLFFH